MPATSHSVRKLGLWSTPIIRSHNSPRDMSRTRRDRNKGPNWLSDKRCRRACARPRSSETPPLALDNRSAMSVINTTTSPRKVSRRSRCHMLDRASFETVGIKGCHTMIRLPMLPAIRASPTSSPQRMLVLAGVGRVSIRAWVAPPAVPRESLPPPLTVKRKEPLLWWESDTDVTRHRTV